MGSFFAIFGVVRYEREPPFFHINEERMQKKCTNCSILLDIPCVTLACPGHHNESVGEICAYCAANEREDGLFFHNLVPEDFGADVEDV